MNIFVSNYDDFLLDIDDTLYEKFGLVTEAMQINMELEQSPVKLSSDSGQCVPSHCLLSNVHIHTEGKHFCSQPEILAINYIQNTVHHSQIAFILNDLSDWLPVGAQNSVSVCYTLDAALSNIHSHLHPQWFALNLPDTSVVYNYYHNNMYGEVLDIQHLGSSIIKYY